MSEAVRADGLVNYLYDMGAGDSKVASGYTLVVPDCEMLRHWQPAIFAADDPSARAAMRRMADGVWDSDLIENGYSKRAYDVEHSSELISDTKKTPLRNVDLPYNVRAVKPVRWLAGYNQHPEAVRLISQWGKSWIERSGDGKPAGVIPAAITFPNNKLRGPGETWYNTGMGWLYSFPTASSMIYDHLLAVWWITGDEAFLQPHRKGLAILEDIDALPRDAAEGSRAWALRKVLNPGSFSSYRLLTGDTQHDGLFLEGGSSYLRWR